MNRSQRVARNVSTTLLTQLITWLLAFAVIFFLPRYAGASGLGAITLAGSFAGIFGLFSSLGLSNVLMRDIPRNPERTGALVVGALVVRLPLAIASTLLGMAAALAMGYSHQVLIYIGISLIGNIIGVFCDVFSCTVRGLETFSIANIGSLIDKVVASAVTITVCIVKGPLWIVVAATLLSNLLSGIYLFRSLRTAKITWVVLPKEELILLVRSGIPFLSAGIFAAIYARSDAIFLSKLSTIAAIGWYGLAVRLSGTAMALPTTLCSAMLPPLSALYKQSLDLFVDGAARLINLMIVCCVPVATAMIFCATPLVGLLSNHSPAFWPANTVVQVYGVAVILYFISQGAATAMIACDQERLFGKAMAIAALFSIPLTAICIYVTQRYMQNGAVGAAASDLLAELYLVTCYLRALPKGSVQFSLISNGVRAIIAAVPLIVQFYFVPHQYVLITTIPFLALYGYLCVLLKCLHTRDIELLETMVRNKIGRQKA